MLKDSQSVYTTAENGVFGDCEYRELSSGDSDVYFRGVKVGTSVADQNILPWEVNLKRYCEPVDLQNGKLLLLDSAIQWEESRRSRVIDRKTLEVFDGPEGLDDTKDSSGTLLNNGLVLIIGGSESAEGLRRLRTWNPSTAEVKAAGKLIEGRVLAKFLHLEDGRVLVIGGQNIPCDRWVVPEIECYDYKLMISKVVGKLEGSFIVRDVFWVSNNDVLAIGFYADQIDYRKTIPFAEIIRLNFAD